MYEKMRFTQVNLNISIICGYSCVTLTLESRSLGDFVALECLAILDLTNRVGGVSYLLVTNAGGLTVVDLYFSRKDDPFEILVCLFLLKLLKSFLRLSKGEAVTFTLTMGKALVVVIVVDVVVVALLLLLESFFGLIRLLFNINIPERD